MQSSRKEQGQFHNKPNIALRLAAILLVSVCLSIWMMNGLFAKYRTSDEGSDGARVIKFGDIFLEESGDFVDGKGLLVPGVNLIKDVDVSFTGSESSTYVFVEVELPSHWSGRTIADSGSTDIRLFFAYQGKIYWTVATSWNYLPIEGEEATTRFVYYRELAPNVVLNKAEFIAGDTITVKDTLTKSDMETIARLPQSLIINLRAVVVQSNGFTGQTETARAQAAWASISNKSN